MTAAEPFFFIQLSDPQFGMFTTNKGFAQETANFEFAVATVNRLRPAFVVITGDLVNQPGDTAQIAEYQRIRHRVDSTVPVYDVAGNHDVDNVPTPAAIAACTNKFGPDHGVVASALRKPARRAAAQRLGWWPADTAGRSLSPATTRAECSQRENCHHNG